MLWCCGVALKARLPNGNGRDVLHTGNAKREGFVSERLLCVVCGAPEVGGGLSPPLRTATLVHGRPGDTLPLRLLVQVKLAQHPRHHVPGPQTGLDEAVVCFGVGQPDLL